jgi:hypothetical protein
MDGQGWDKVKKPGPADGGRPGREGVKGGRRRSRSSWRAGATGPPPTLASRRSDGPCGLSPALLRSTSVCLARGLDTRDEASLLEQQGVIHEQPRRGIARKVRARFGMARPARLSGDDHLKHRGPRHTGGGRARFGLDCAPPDIVQLRIHPWALRLLGVNRIGEAACPTSPAKRPCASRARAPALSPQWDSAAASVAMPARVRVAPRLPRRPLSPASFRLPGRCSAALPIARRGTPGLDRFALDRTQHRGPGDNLAGAACIGATCGIMALWGWTSRPRPSEHRP